MSIQQQPVSMDGWSTFLTLPIKPSRSCYSEKAWSTNDLRDPHHRSLQRAVVNTVLPAAEVTFTA